MRQILKYLKFLFRQSFDLLEEIALAIIDCGGTLRCGLYPKKRIPTINTNPVGKSGPLAQFITEDIYVSGVTSSQVSLAEETEGAPQEVKAEAPKQQEAETAETGEVKFSADKKVSETLAAQKNKSLITKIGLGAGKVVATFNQAARDAVQTCITTLLPFMAFVSMLIGIINGSGFGDAFASLLTPLTGNIFGLVILGVICSIPGLSALLGPGAVIAQIIGTLIGAEIGRGNIPPNLVFAVGCSSTPIQKDGKDVNIILMLGVPENSEDGQNKLIQAYDEIIELTRDDALLKKIAGCESSQELIRALYR